MDPIAWRFIERILAVAIGGMAVYLGYRLFLKIPTSHDSQGRIVLPWNITIALSRVGPGVFFALFGAIVVAYALHASVSYTREGPMGEFPQASASVGREGFSGMLPAGGASSTEASAAARLRARAQIGWINSLPQLARRELSAEQKQELGRRIAALKLALMEPLWRPEVWGDLAAFKDWAEGGAADPVPVGLEAAAGYYRFGMEEAQ